MNRENYRRCEDWRDLAFTALPPGWVNVYKMDDGAHFTTACPGVLLQEATEYTEGWDEDVDGGIVRRVRRGSMHRETRTVAAEIEYGQVRPADVADNYQATVLAEERDSHRREEAGA